MKEIKVEIFIIQHETKNKEYMESNWDNIAHSAFEVDSGETHSVWCLTGHEGFISKEKALKALDLVRKAEPKEKFRIAKFYIEQRLIAIYYDKD
jgi:hypothetical protein